MITEKNLIRLLLYNDEFRQKVMPKIEDDLIHDLDVNRIYKLCKQYYEKNNKFPSSVIKVLITNNPWGFGADKDYIQSMVDIVDVNQDEYKDMDISELIVETESWWKDRMLKRLFQYSLDIIKGVSVFNTTKIDETLAQINAFSFQDDIVFSVYENEKMIEYYTNEESRVKFLNEDFNYILGGGLKKQSFNLILGGTHTGKTRWMVSLACDYLRRSKKNKILYITLEMPLSSISTFFDMNFLNMKEKDLLEMVRKDKDLYISKKKEIQEKYGTFYLKEYPADSISPSVIHSLIDDMIKRGNPPDMIFVDYAQLLIPNGGAKGLTMFEKGDLISKQLRSISQIFEIPVWSGAQPKTEADKLNKKGGSGADAYGVSGSKGVPENADFIMNIIQTEQMKANCTQIITLPKNRHSGITYKCLMATFDRDLYKSEFVGVSESTFTEEGEDNKPTNENTSDDNKPLINTSFKPKFS